MPVFRPGKPYYSGRLSAPQASATGEHNVEWDDVDVDGEWGVLTNDGDIVCEVPGLYVVVFNAFRSSTAGSWIVRLYLNDGLVAASTVGAANFALGLGVSWAGQLERFDVVSTRAFSGAGAGWTAGVDGTNVLAARIGPVRWT